MLMAWPAGRAAIDRRAAAMGVVLRDLRVQPRSRQPATKSAVS
jgi:hypothetical protein